MPTYTFINKKTKKVIETEIMTIAEMEQRLIDHPEQDVLPGAPVIAFSQLGSSVKVDNEFKDRLREIKKAHRGSTIEV